MQRSQRIIWVMFTRCDNWTKGIKRQVYMSMAYWLCRKKQPNDKMKKKEARTSFLVITVEQKKKLDAQNILAYLQHKPTFWSVLKKSNMKQSYARQPDR